MEREGALFWIQSAQSSANRRVKMTLGQPATSVPFPLLGSCAFIQSNMKGLLSSAIALAGCVTVMQTVEAYQDVHDAVQVSSSPSPCNGFPDQYKLPVDQFFWLGAHGALNSNHQDRSITDMLNDGIRWLDVTLCESSKKKGEVELCGSDLTLIELADQVLDFARTEPEQVVVVHVSSAPEGVALDETFETAWDVACELHTRRTEGTKEFKKGECPFVYTHTRGRWPSLGKLVDYDPEMPQWEGDGELVGVRSKIILTTEPGLKRNTNYFSDPFWTPTLTQDADEVKDQLHDLCKKTGGIRLDAYADPLKQETVPFWEEAIMSSSGCNINETPRNSYLSTILVDFYENYLDYLTELQERMVALNYAKWEGSKHTVAPSKLVIFRRVRDEL
ncbi:hypothetical protein BX666DRAFT_2124797 [Dichotomocladium elegans]|nr:hypothetical protein BX666DRAFT_2124797 [Dichotomocladium elegans]